MTSEDTADLGIASPASPSRNSFSVAVSPVHPKRPLLCCLDMDHVTCFKIFHEARMSGWWDRSGYLSKFKANTTTERRNIISGTMTWADVADLTISFELSTDLKQDRATSLRKRSRYGIVFSTSNYLQGQIETAFYSSTGPATNTQDTSTNKGWQ